MCVGCHCILKLILYKRKVNIMNSLVYTSLYKLFCTLQVYKQQLHGFHWNATGDSFYQIHLLFDRVYTSIVDLEDRLAEHIRGYGYTPSRYSEYLATSSIKESDCNIDVSNMLALAIEDLGLIRNDLKVANEEASKAKRYGTLNMLGDIDETFDSIFFLLASNKKGFNLG